MSPQKFAFSLTFQRRYLLTPPFLLAKSKKILVPQNDASRIVKCRFVGTSDSCFDRRSVLISQKAFGETLFSQGLPLFQSPEAVQFPSRLAESHDCLAATDRLVPGSQTDCQ